MVLLIRMTRLPTEQVPTVFGFDELKKVIRRIEKVVQGQLFTCIF